MQTIRNGWAAGCLIAAFLILFPSSARADAGIPMMPVRYPQLLLYIIPVVAIETIYMKWNLQSPWRRTLVAVTGANIVTMGLGYPLAYGVYAGLNWSLHFPDGVSPVFSHLGWLPVWLCVRLFPAWAGVEEGGKWPVLVMFVLLLLPGFIISAFVKTWMIGGYDLLNAQGSTRNAVWGANRLSYLFLVVTGCVILYQIVSQSPGVQ
jgi:hypothetical protein